MPRGKRGLSVHGSFRWSEGLSSGSDLKGFPSVRFSVSKFGHSDCAGQGCVDAGISGKLGRKGEATGGAGLLALVHPLVEAAKAEVVLTRRLQHQWRCPTSLPDSELIAETDLRKRSVAALSKNSRRNFCLKSDTEVQKQCDLVVFGGRSM